MKPIPFEQCNTEFAKDQPQYLPLPAELDKDGRVTTCWKLSFRERLIVLWTGKVWARVLTFNKPLQPQKLFAWKNNE